MNCCSHCTWERRIRGKKPKLVEETLIDCEQTYKIEKPHYTSDYEWSAKYNGKPDNAKITCTKKSCVKHQTKCNDCNKEVCCDCMIICNHCSKDLCQDCSMYCSECIARVCSYCSCNTCQYHGYSYESD